MRAKFHPAAQQELAAALNFGESRGAGLGAELLVETQGLTELLCITPLMGEAMDERHRRFPLRRFPFALIYRVEGDDLYVVAFAHRRRRPGYWHRRG